MTKDVALVLSSGGPRGFAYIGAIEELESRGYHITSIAGASMGSLIGGIYAAGKLHEVKDWLFDLDAWKVFSLMDLSFSKSYVMKGDKVIDAIKEIVPEIDIRDLRIPYCAIATDLYTGDEVIFDQGPLFNAIRASISIPSLFRPVEYGRTFLVDGGLVNTIPLNRVHRNGHDIVVAFNVNDIDRDSIVEAMNEEERKELQLVEKQEALDAETRKVFDAVKNSTNLTFGEKIKLAAQQSHKVLMNNFSKDKEPANTIEFETSYYSILDRSFDIMNHINARNSIAMYKPDVLASMPFDAFGSIKDYAKAPEISELGRELMKEALDEYESKVQD